MAHQKIIFLMFSVLSYSAGELLHQADVFGSVCVNTPEIPAVNTKIEVLPLHEKQRKKVVQTKPTKQRDVYLKNCCYVLDIFTKRPLQTLLTLKEMESGNNTVAVFGVTVFLLALVIHAVMDVLSVTKEERIRNNQNPIDDRRQSLSGFAKKKCSKQLSLQLLEIGECMGTDEKIEINKEIKPTCSRTDSKVYYLDKISTSEGNTKGSQSLTEDTRHKKQSSTKLFGSGPGPMGRRSSFPGLPLNPNLQDLMLQRSPSTDSDDDDARGKRVRIIRRY